MTEKTHTFLLSLLLCFAITGAADCEDGWIGYKDELCIKTVEMDDLITNEQAEVLCSLQGDGGSLLMIKEPELQEFVANYTQNFPDNMWLGGKYDTQSGIFKWEDGEPLTYTNWADGFPKNITESETCISLRISDNVEAKWEGVACGRRSLALCQKALRWTLQDSVNKHLKNWRRFLKLEEELGTAKVELQSMKEELKELKQKFQKTKQEHKQEIGTVNTALQSTNDDLKRTKQNYQKTKMELEELFVTLKVRVYIDRIARYIQIDNPEEAFEEFQKMGDNNTLSIIAKDAYSRNPNNVEKITKFVKLLPNCSQVVIAYASLYDEIKKYGNFTIHR